jgi:hypothetical protein
MMVSFLPPLHFARTVTPDRRSPRAEPLKIWGGAAQTKSKFELIKQFSIYKGTTARFVGRRRLFYLRGLAPMQPLLQWLVCAGSQDAVSFLADWKPVKRVDIYAGVMVSNVYGGLANGFPRVQNIDPATGIRVRF